MTMIGSVRWLVVGLALLALSLLLVYSPPKTRAAVGINKLSSEVSGDIDRIVKSYVGKSPNKATKLTMAVVFAGQIVYARSYAAAGFTADSLAATHQWASVSKTLTALVAFRMLERRQLSLDTPIWDYDPSYLNKIPAQYQVPPLNLKHLLTHTGGVNHLGPLSWTRSPAEVFFYSTNGYGIIGTDVLPAIRAPDTYPALVEEEIATPIGAASIGVAQPTNFIAPGAYVTSNITDLAKYAIAIMDDELVTPETLYEQVLQRHIYVFDPGTGGYIDRGLGFKLESFGDNLLAAHHGDNGKPEAMLFVRPRKKLAVCVFCDATTSADADDVDTESLAKAIESQLTSVSNPCAVPDDCAVLTSSLGTPPLTNPSRVMLSWIPFGSNYAVQRGTAAGGPYSTVATLTGTTYTDTGLTSGSTYYYRVSDGLTYTNEERVVLPLFKDDFEDGNSAGWTRSGGTWTIGADLTRYFHQNNQSGQYTAVASSAGPWTNYSVQANVKVFGFGSSNGWAGLLARYTDASNYYYVTLQRNNTLQLRKKVGGVDSLLAGKAFTVTAGATTPDVGPVYLVKLEANGSTLKCYLDGRLELTATDASHSSGRVGVITNGADALFDEILVKRLPVTSDFNTDGKTDLVWQNQTTGQIGVWCMDGTVLTSVSFFNPGLVTDTDWKLVGTADFDSDGQPDLVWQNQATGQIGVWFMNGTNLISHSLFNPGQVTDVDWKLVGTGDFNSDSKPDLVWQNQATGQIGLWFMEGIALTSISFFNPPQVTDTNWKIAAAVDFDSDGHPDLVWQNQATGQIGVWFMSGVSLSRVSLFNPPQVPDTNWKIVGVSDFDGDNQADLVWQNQVTGQIGVWFMSGVSLSRVNFFVPSQVTDTSWRITQVWNLLTAPVSPISTASSGLRNNLLFIAPRLAGIGLLGNRLWVSMKSMIP